MTGFPPALAGYVYADQPLEVLESIGALTIEGDRDALERFAALFDLPPKVGA